MSVAERVILQGNPNAAVKLVARDVARESAAKELIGGDSVFLAADSMRARLVFNAVVHQYLIPGVQLGSKIRTDRDGALVEVMSANRPARPGNGCLWCNQLIEANELAKEAKTDEERKAQAYGVEEPNRASSASTRSLRRMLSMTSCSTISGCARSARSRITSIFIS